MVDPDNRRAVDYGARASALDALEKPNWPELVSAWPDGRVKLAWTRYLLKLRQLHSDVFVKGDYIPLEVHGRDRDHVIAFARRYGPKAVIVAVGRWFAPFTDDGRLWPQTHAIEAEIDLANIKTKFQANRIRLSEHFKELPILVITA